ncbi:MAG: glycoside hydrolase family 76 protein [Anditalea sp.]
MQLATYNAFISENGQYFAQNNGGDQTFHYWWNAHVMDVLVDAKMRRDNLEDEEKMLTVLRGIKSMNEGSYLNNYYDDMEWLALSSLRAYGATGEAEYLEVSEILWEDIKKGWNDHQGGGIAWRKTQLDYKNTPANAPAVILAARLFKEKNRPEDLEWAKRIYHWQKTNLVDPSTGLVWDGINRNGDNEIDKGWKFTYNQGVYIGAAVELFLVTNDQTYLDDAIRTANHVVKDAHFAPGGVLRSEGMGDGGLFKGILVRYMTYMIQNVDLPKDRSNAYMDFLRHNAETVYANIKRPQLLIGPSWDKSSDAVIDASVQLSGLMMLESMASLDEEK